MFTLAQLSQSLSNLRILVYGFFPTWERAKFLQSRNSYFLPSFFPTSEISVRTSCLMPHKHSEHGEDVGLLKRTQLHGKEIHLSPHLLDCPLPQALARNRMCCPKTQGTGSSLCPSGSWLCFLLFALFLGLFSLLIVFSPFVSLLLFPILLLPIFSLIFALFLPSLSSLKCGQYEWVISRRNKSS